jgi:hypothetical protein
MAYFPSKVHRQRDWLKWWKEKDLSIPGTRMGSSRSQRKIERAKIANQVKYTVRRNDFIILFRFIHDLVAAL